MDARTLVTRVRRSVEYRWRKLLTRIGLRPPRNRYPEEYAIDIWTGSSPGSLSPGRGLKSRLNRPAYTRLAARRDKCMFPADPFLIHRDGRWYLFYEQLKWTDHKGLIAVASSKNLRRWRYHGEVLEESTHLSYPQLIEHDGQVYMLPESGASGMLTIYRCRDFPMEWEPAATLLEGSYADSTVLLHEGHWYIFTCPHVRDHDELRLFVSEDLFGPYNEHPNSPLITQDPTAARPAGNILKMDGYHLRFSQICVPTYGSGVRGFQIDTLSPTEYSETPQDQTVLSASGEGWNSYGMHHVDAHERPDGSWFAAVDGWHIVKR